MADEVEAGSVDTGSSITDGNGELDAGAMEREFNAQNETAGGEQDAGSNGDGPEVTGQEETVDAAAQAQITWENQPLPPGHPGLAAGMRTQGEYDQRYRASSAEARRLAEERAKDLENYKAVLQHYKAKVRAQQEAQKPGFDMNTFQQLAQTNPEKAIAMAMEHELKSNPKIVQDLVNPMLQPYEREFQQLKEAKQQEQMRAKKAADYNELLAKHPEAKQGTPEFNVAAKWYDENKDVLDDIAQAYPHVNTHEIAYKMATYDLLLQKSNAQSAKLVDKRSKAGTVRPGNVGATTSATGSAARDAASDLAARGINPPDEATIQAMERALRLNFD